MCGTSIPNDKHACKTVCPGSTEKAFPFTLIVIFSIHFLPRILRNLINYPKNRPEEIRTSNFDDKPHPNSLSSMGRGKGRVSSFRFQVEGPSTPNLKPQTSS